MSSDGEMSLEGGVDPILAMDTFIAGGLSNIRWTSNAPKKQSPFQFACKCHAKSGKVVVQEMLTRTVKRVSFVGSPASPAKMCKFSLKSPFTSLAPPCLLLFLVSSEDEILVSEAKLLFSSHQPPVAQLAVDLCSRTKCRNSSPIIDLAVSEGTLETTSVCVAHRNGFVSWLAARGPGHSLVEAHVPYLDEHGSVFKSLLSFSETGGAGLEEEGEEEEEAGLPNRVIKLHQEHPVISLACWEDVGLQPGQPTSSFTRTQQGSVSVCLAVVLWRQHIVFARLSSPFRSSTALLPSTPVARDCSFCHLPGRHQAICCLKFIPLYRFPLVKRDRMQCVALCGDGRADIWIWNGDPSRTKMKTIELIPPVSDQVAVVTFVNITTVHCLEGQQGQTKFFVFFLADIHGATYHTQINATEVFLSETGSPEEGKKVVLSRTRQTNGARIVNLCYADSLQKIICTDVVGNVYKI